MKAGRTPDRESSGEGSPRIFLLNTKDIVRNPNSYMTLGVAEGFRAHLPRDSVTVVANSNIAEKAHECHPDAVVCFDGEEVQYDTILEIRKMGIPVVAWLTEDPYELHTNLRNQHLYDVVFTTERSVVSKYEPRKALFLPLGASKSLCYYPVRESHLYDVCVAGTAWPERVDWCRRLLQKLPNLRWKFILHRPQAEVPNYSFPRPIAETDFRLSIGDLCRVFNQSKIVISLKREFSSATPQVGMSPAPRIFETSLSGTAQLAQAVENDEIGQYFDIGKEIDIFQSVQECVNRIESLLQDQLRRREMALKSQQRVLKDHLYANRAIAILEWIRSQPRTKRVLVEPPRRLLVCVHSSVQSKVFGGMEVMTEELVDQLKTSWSVFLLYPAHVGKAVWRLVDMSTGKIEQEYTVPVNEATAFAPTESARFKRILLNKQIGLVHFQHLIGFPLELPLAARELGIPYTITWGDYPVCHKFTLLNTWPGVYCHPDRIPIESCDVCLNSSHGYMAGSQLARRALISRVMLGSNAIVCLSEIQRDMMNRIFPEVAHMLQVIEPIDSHPPMTADSSRTTRREGPLAVAVTGNFARQKGADVALPVMNYYKNSDDIIFHILGRVDPEYDTILTKTGLRSASNIHVLGGYRPSQRHSIFDGIDVALFLSIWPEGYPMTLEDLKKANVPCIASDMGEMGRQIINGVNGWLVPPYDAGSVISVLNRLIEDRSPLDSMRAKLKETLRPRPTYAERMGFLFERVLSQRTAPPMDRMLSIKQTKWLGEKMKLYSTEGTLWANRGPIATPQREISPLVSSATAALVTPREAIRRFKFYAKQHGLMGAIGLAVEYLSK